MPSTNTPTTKPPRLQISATQLIASALAAVTATFAASYLGVSGTVIGAAIASVVTVTGNAVYGHSLHRTSERVRTVVPTRARWLPPAKQDDVAPADPPKATSPFTRRLAIASVAVFAAVLAVVTSVEVVAGRPLSDLLRGTSGQGTTVFGPQHQARGKSTPTPTAPTVTQTVVPKVVVTTPTVTQTAPPATKTTTPTVTTTPPATAPPSTAPPSTPPTGPAPPPA